MNDKTINNAIEWAKAQLNSTEYSGWCLSFIEDAVEKSNGIEIFGGDCARESAGMYHARNNSGEPPVGAFVFYDCNGTANGETVDWGHCGLCIGDGMVIHAWDKVRIDSYLDIEKLKPMETWTAPKYIGWVDIQTVLDYRE